MKIGNEKARERLLKTASVIGNEAFEAVKWFMEFSSIEKLEKKMGWPSRSGWKCISLIATFLANINSDRDMMIR